MPTFRYFRQWGAISPEYMAAVEKKIVEAVEKAQADLAPAALYLAARAFPIPLATALVALFVVAPERFRERLPQLGIFVAAAALVLAPLGH